MKHEHCPLCLSLKTTLFSQSSIKNLERDYLICKSCELIFVPSKFHISHSDEKKRYLEHNNDINDPKYQEFLSKLLDQLIPKLGEGYNGLDFGAGPGPALVNMLEKSGFNMKSYDLFFQPDKSVLKSKYDFITCTETVEHFTNPRKEFKILDSISKPGAWIGIMTSLFEHSSSFPDWYYQRDPTHVAFYSEQTMGLIAKMLNWEIILPSKNIILFKKSCDTDDRIPS
tara:strand:- start:190 stop:870 length:681 start_codon:yes stop_codon:yes gene_type:complete